MRKLLLVFILMQTLYIETKSQSIYTGRKEASNFREGIFRYEESPYNNTKVTRTKNYQEEDHQSTKVKVRFKIDWVSDFEYHLTFNKVSDKTGNCLIGKVIKVKILEAHENSWKIYTEFEGKFSTFTMTKTGSLPKRKLLSLDKEN